MKKIIISAACALVLSGCAQTPEQAAAYRQFGMQMLAAQAQAQNQPIAAPAYAPPRQTRCYTIGNQLNCRSF